ncbi:MAG: RNA-directed DNA polymerase [Solobacterium sp.]|jgi:hypothetical protein|nr:RNA-directed DNA polymerase [Solobacterium sp.]MCH4205281.1 RNA-directed DNA polymerase [Solobacterium sp.]MCH4226874.1 RNA-directed DNA polymerase [Solobacterium sp.]MCH4281634.1 RNA-directed DNA polymerase [Solobacterium sp.]
MKNIEDVYNANNLIKAFSEAKKGTAWKEAVQRYECNYLLNTYHLQQDLKSGKYKQKKLYEFKINERGKCRDVKSMFISDRIVQRSLCDNVITPAIVPYLIYDNGASLKGKGISFTRSRLEKHLHNFYQQNKSNNGYILLIDFSKYFDNIRHDKLYELLCKHIKDDGIRSLIKNILSSFDVDVSYMSDDQYAKCMFNVFNSLDYASISKTMLTGEKFMHKSVGIGSQVSQSSGIYYPSEIDTFCKNARGVKFYGRYMDDTYVISQSKNRLESLLNEITELCMHLGIFINHKKTQVVKLSHGFSFLKIHYILTNTGKVLKKLNVETFTREKRKLKKFKKRYSAGTISLDDIVHSYLGWCGSVKKYKANRKSLHTTDCLFFKCFPEYIKINKKERKIHYEDFR